MKRVSCYTGSGTTWPGSNITHLLGDATSDSDAGNQTWFQMKANMEEEAVVSWLDPDVQPPKRKNKPPKTPNPAETEVHVRGSTLPVGEEPRRRPQEAAGLERFPYLTGVTKLES